MEVQPDILKKLLCSVCGEYLSCAPVRMKNDGTVLCGRCCDPDNEPTLRITPYEQLAEMMLFPCANKTHGCTETLYMADMKQHEEECLYRQYVCPVVESEQCNWSGPRRKLLGHCTQKHANNLLPNPYTIHHQLNKNVHKTFLLAAFEMLFLIHCKICTTSKNIYHSVKLIGKSEIASQFNFELEVASSHGSVIAKKDVARQGSMSLQEDLSMQLDFNTLFSCLGALNDVTCKVKVGRKCSNCEKCVIKPGWRVDDGWCCVDCAPGSRPCLFNSRGCTYVGDKAYEHECFSCKYGTRCFMCIRHEITEPREQHNEHAHSNVTYEAGAICRIPVVNESERFIIATVHGPLYCSHSLEDSVFTLEIWSGLHAEQLLDYRCVAKLMNPVTGHAVRQIPPMLYNDPCYWEININEDEFVMYVSDNEFDLQIELIKK